MKFRAQFCGNGWRECAVRYPTEQLGTDIVKKIREVPRWRDISIYPRITNAGHQASVTIDIEEGRAFDIPAFRSSAYVEVAVPKFALTRFGSTAEPEERLIDGRWQVIVFYHPNETSILKAWGAAGYPIEWNPENPGEPFPIRDGFFK